MKKTYILVKSTVFLLLLCVFFSHIQGLFIWNEGDNFQLQEGFFQEPSNSLDVVYIGASPTFTSWSTPIAYKKYGITSWVYANNSQPFVAIQSFLELARERQPNAIFMICINGQYYSSELAVEAIHSTVDNFKLSFEKIALIDQLCHDFQSTPQECLELFFPIVRYHSRWSMLSKNSFHKSFESFKGAYHHPQFFTSTDISTNKIMTDKFGKLPKFTEYSLKQLLCYCKEDNVKVVFVLSAQYRNEQVLQWYNTLVDEIEAKGFPLVNEIADFDKIGLDDTKDFYNVAHTNIHGALKITDYLSQYLLDHYDFPEKSGGGTRAGMKRTTNIKRSSHHI